MVQRWYLVDLSEFVKRRPLLFCACAVNHLVFGWHAGELCDAEDEVKAAQLDVAAVVENGGALPSCPAAPDQTGAAGFTTTRVRARLVCLAAHHRTHLTHLQRLLRHLLLSFLTTTWRETKHVCVNNAAYRKVNAGAGVEAPPPPQRQTDLIDSLS